MSARDSADKAAAKQRMHLPKRDRSLHVHPSPAKKLDLSAKRLVMVGGTDGLGRAIAARAVAQGAHVTVVGRTFRDTPSPRLTFVRADLSSMRTATEIGRELPAENADVLFFSTGIIAAPTREETTEGVERDLAVGFLNRLAILEQVADRVGTARPDSTAKPRVFCMGSPGWGELGTPTDLNSEQNYTSSKAHGNSIAGNEALVLAGADRYPQLAFFGLAPGVIKTGIRSNLLGEGSMRHRIIEGLIGVLAQSASTYAEHIVPLLFADEIEGRSGAVFNRKGRPILPSRGFDKDYAHRFLTASETILERAMATGQTH
ncbi:SDR family NAD(P)-dependent oxidoreductase [Streptomyces chartreusis]|uniref:SDR family NAD(P)-dependent oxidoreductase n=1 Tax=Streptomyces chartreusis TaxID=1969 RepID=UPI0037179AD6